MIILEGQCLFSRRSRSAEWNSALVLTNVVGIGTSRQHLTVGLPRDQVTLLLMARLTIPYRLLCHMNTYRTWVKKTTKTMKSMVQCLLAQAIWIFRNIGILGMARRRCRR